MGTRERVIEGLAALHGIENPSMLHDYKTGDAIREATDAERLKSRAAAEHDGGAGVIEVDGRHCYVVE